MKTVFAVLALLFSSAAMPVCYQIYSSSNEVVWQGGQPPIVMDTLSINDEVKKIVPNGHLVVVDDRMAPCHALDSTGGKAEQYWKAREKRSK